MTVHPEDYIARTARLGAMMMNVHIEACGDKTPTVIRDIHDAGMKAAITISPDTPVDSVRPYISDVDMVLVMGVYPGFGGQKFIEATTERVRQLIVSCHPFLPVGNRTDFSPLITAFRTIPATKPPYIPPS